MSVINVIINCYHQGTTFLYSNNPFLEEDSTPEDDTPLSHFPPTRFGGGFMSEYDKGAYH